LFESKTALKMEQHPSSSDMGTDNGAADRKERHRIYVANLPPRVTTEELEEVFSKIGKVIGVLIPKSAKYAFVDYSTLEDAMKAVAELHQFVLNGNTLKVEMGKGEVRLIPGEKGDRRRTARTKNRVIVTGLSSGLSWQDLKDIMRETGGDVTFTSIKDNVGFAEFGSEEDVERAIAKLNDTEVRGSRISVKRDDVTDRELERDQPKRDNRKRRGDDRRGRRNRSRSPPRRQRGRSRERRRSRSRRSPDDRRRRDKEDKDRDSRRRRDSDSSGSRSPRRRRGRSN